VSISAILDRQDNAPPPAAAVLARDVDVITQCQTRGFENKEVKMARAKSAVPEGHHTVTPQLTLDNAVQALVWYKKALGAE
jgi:hypothetical protein